MEEVKKSILVTSEYSADPDMWKVFQSKLPELTLELFIDYIFGVLQKYDRNPSLLALWVGYQYNDKGFKFDNLRSVAEKLRDHYYKQLSEQTNSKYAYGWSESNKRKRWYDWKKDFSENGYEKLDSIRKSFDNSRMIKILDPEI